MQYTINFPAGQTDYYLNASYLQLLQAALPKDTIIITDKNVHHHYGQLFASYKVLIIEPGEQSKSWELIQDLAIQLAHLNAHKTSTLVGIGGGVVCDITGFLATIYMRGIPFAFVPTTLLAMVDAAIGGKNGINVGLNKNMLGSIRQPKFILYDSSFLATLPAQEWSSGFAEVIKYACIGDAALSEQLARHTILDFQENTEQLNSLIAQCVQHKNEIVLADEQEKSIRKTLNFGHTAGHAFETIYQLQHGEAVALGMIVAFIASERSLALPIDLRPKLGWLLRRYHLPLHLNIDVEKVLNTIRHDKKRNNEVVDFVLLTSIGEAVVHPLSFGEIRTCLQIFSDEYHC